MEVLIEILLDVIIRVGGWGQGGKGARGAVAP